MIVESAGETARRSSGWIRSSSSRWEAAVAVALSAARRLHALVEAVDSEPAMPLKRPTAARVGIILVALLETISIYIY